MKKYKKFYKEYNGLVTLTISSDKVTKVDVYYRYKHMTTLGYIMGSKSILSQTCSNTFREFSSATHLNQEAVVLFDQEKLTKRELEFLGFVEYTGHYLAESP